MGLEDFKAEESDTGSSISTRKKVKNVTFEKENVARVVTSHPGTLYTLAAGTDEAGRKALVQMCQNIIAGDHDVRVGKLGDTSHLESVVDEVVEDFIE